jgi:hypothetical protein
VCGLAGTLQADQHEDRWGRASEGDLRRVGIVAAKHLHQFVVHDADDMLRGRQALQHFLPQRTLLHVIDELLDQLEIHIGFEQRLAHLAHGVRDVFFSDFALAPQAVKDRVETLGETFKH